MCRVVRVGSLRYLLIRLSRQVRTIISFSSKTQYLDIWPASSQHKYVHVRSILHVLKIKLWYLNYLNVPLWLWQNVRQSPGIIQAWWSLVHIDTLTQLLTTSALSTKLRTILTNSWTTFWELKWSVEFSGGWYAVFRTTRIWKEQWRIYLQQQ